MTRPKCLTDRIQEFLVTLLPRSQCKSSDPASRIHMLLQVYSPNVVNVAPGSIKYANNSSIMGDWSALWGMSGGSGEGTLGCL